MLRPSTAWRQLQKFSSALFVPSRANRVCAAPSLSTHSASRQDETARFMLASKLAMLPRLILFLAFTLAFASAQTGPPSRSTAAQETRTEAAFQKAAVNTGSLRAFL